MNAATQNKVQAVRARGRPLSPAEKRAKRRSKKAKPREPWHGTVNGYTNHKCRCDKCKAAMADYQTRYRQRRFDGQTCARKGCKSVPSKAKGNGLCYRHAREAEL